jgi:hypothetical protein
LFIVSQSRSRRLEQYHRKSEKARKSANARWRNSGDNKDANALRTQCEGNAKQETINNNHKTINNNQGKGRMKRPTLEQIESEFNGRIESPKLESEKFFNHYESNGWKVGKNPMKSWKHAVTNWITRSKSNGNQTGNGFSNRPPSRADEARAEIDRLFGSAEDGVIEGDYEQVGKLRLPE